MVVCVSPSTMAEDTRRVLDFGALTQELTTVPSTPAPIPAPTPAPAPAPIYSSGNCIARVSFDNLLIFISPHIKLPLLLPARMQPLYAWPCLQRKSGILGLHPWP